MCSAAGQTNIGFRASEGSDPDRDTDESTLNQRQSSTRTMCCDGQTDRHRCDEGSVLQRDLIKAPVELESTAVTDSDNVL